MPEHHAVAEHAGLAEHAPHRDAAEGLSCSHRNSAKSSLATIVDDPSADILATPDERVRILACVRRQCRSGLLPLRDAELRPTEARGQKVPGFSAGGVQIRIAAVRPRSSRSPRPRAQGSARRRALAAADLLQHRVGDHQRRLELAGQALQAARDVDGVRRPRMKARLCSVPTDRRAPAGP
jgi:hypothetical protein